MSYFLLKLSTEIKKKLTFHFLVRYSEKTSYLTLSNQRKFVIFALVKHAKELPKKNLSLAYLIRGYDLKLASKSKAVSLFDSAQDSQISLTVSFRF